MPSIINFFLPALIAFAATYGIGKILLKPAFARYFIEEPGGNKLHRNPVPASGGIALFIGILFTALLFEGSLLFQNYFYILLAFVLLFLLGLIDDLKPLGWMVKLGAQLILIIGVVLLADLRIESVLLDYSFFKIPYTSSVFLSICVLIFFINAFNFIDGIDGLATTVALLFILGLMYFRIPFSPIFLMCTGAGLFAFRRLNKSPAKIFMGDSGSLSIGFLCATLFILFCEGDVHVSSTNLYTDQLRLPIALTLFWYPIFDTLRVLIIRLSSGKSLFKRDKKHSYSLLLRVGYSHNQIVIVVVVLTICQLAICLLVAPRVGLIYYFMFQVVIWLGLHGMLLYIVQNHKKISNNS